MADKNGRHFERYDDELFHTLYENLAAQQNNLSPHATRDKLSVRRLREPFHVSRPNFVKDTERILHCSYFNRYADKTQVFSLYKNDDITRRILHVQIVSRIGRNIGRMLNLNQDLIEAIALGHDLGHTPFGHAGERFLSALLHRHTGRYFNHNVQSVRILDTILGLNMSLQTLDGILCHNGEKVTGEYRPFQYPPDDIPAMFRCLEEKMESCSLDEDGTDRLIPGTLEGCVVRLSDIIAYLGKDRQDASILHMAPEEEFVENELLGSTNSEFIANIITNLVHHSYGKGYLMLDPAYSDALSLEKNINFEKIYSRQNEVYAQIKVMFEQVYERLVSDFEAMDQRSPLFRHHVNLLYRGRENESELKARYLASGAHQTSVDYIAGMTDDYFIDLHHYFYPDAPEIKYRSYFSDR